MRGSVERGTIQDRYYLEKRDPTCITDVLKDVEKSRQLRLRARCGELFKAWHEVVGSEAAKHAKVEAFRGGVLFIRVDGAVWLHELKCFRKAGLLAGLRQRMSKVYVRDIQFSIGSIVESD